MATTYGTLFSANLRAARARANLSQPDVSRRMIRLGFATWDPSKVSKAERGVGPVLVAELLALSVCLETTIGELAGVNTPPMEVVSFPEPMYQLTGVNIRNSAFNFSDGAVRWDGDYPSIIRPASIQSAAATDKSNQISQVHPSRMARDAHGDSLLSA